MTDFFKYDIIYIIQERGYVMSEWKKSAIEHKYAELPEKPRYKKKKKKVRVRSDHKHIYACSIFDSGQYEYRNHEKVPAYNIITYCVRCGRIDDIHYHIHLSDYNLPVLKKVDVWTCSKINLEDIGLR